jgi:RNA polymerase sigma factor (sigma-70 family)
LSTATYFVPVTPSDDSAATDRRNKLVESYLYLAKDVARDVAATIPKSFDLEDLTSDGYLGLIRAAERFRPEAGVPFVAYATRIIRWEIYSAIRRKAYEENTRAPLPATAPEAYATVEMESEIDTARLHSAVAAAVATLASQQRDVIRLHYREDMRLCCVGRSIKVGRSRASKIHMEAVRALRLRLASAT